MHVQDTGIGFEVHTAERLFEAFYSTKTQGMGIGLSVSRSIIERHRGRIWAAPNMDGPGATFAFIIPLEKTSDAAGRDSSYQYQSIMDALVREAHAQAMERDKKA